MKPTQRNLLFALAFVFVASFGNAASGENNPANSNETTKSNIAAAVDRQPYLGVGAAALHPALTRQLPEILGKGRGVLVANVMKGSPAEEAGLTLYDILVSYDKQDVYSPEQLVKLVRNDKAGREVTLAYVREGKMHEVAVRLGEGPELTAKSPPVKRFFSPRPSSLEAEASGGDPLSANAPWAKFQSMTIKKTADGRYQAEIEFRNADKVIIHRDYAGTRKEIREAMRDDNELPAQEREHLLRALDQQSPLLNMLPAPFRRIDWNEELFNWPDLRDF